MVVDTEWGSDEKYLSLQVFIPERKLLIFYSLKKYETIVNDSLESLILENQKPFPDCRQMYRFVDSLENVALFDDVLFLLKEFYDFSKYSKIKVELEFYYAIRDLYPVFGTYFITDLMSEKFGKKNYITSKRCLFGSFDWNSEAEITPPVTIHLKDLYGWVNTGLNDLFFVANIPNSSKNDEDMNKMKSCMEKCFSDQSLTKKLILYSLGDVIL
jgi:hypothetical protein